MFCGCKGGKNFLLSLLIFGSLPKSLQIRLTKDRFAGEKQTEAIYTYIVVESRTNRIELVGSRQHKVYKTIWSHSCQPRGLPVRPDTLIQEGNYLSHARHIWQGDTPKISAHGNRTASSAEQDHPQIGSWANYPLASGVPRQLSRDPEGWSTIFIEMW